MKYIELYYQKADKTCIKGLRLIIINTICKRVDYYINLN